MVEEPKKTVHLVLTQEEYEKLKCLANETCRTVPNYLRRVIYHHLRRQECMPPTAKAWWGEV